MATRERKKADPCPRRNSRSYENSEPERTSLFGPGQGHLAPGAISKALRICAGASVQRAPRMSILSQKFQKDCGAGRTFFGDRPKQWRRHDESQLSAILLCLDRSPEHHASETRNPIRDGNMDGFVSIDVPATGGASRQGRRLRIAKNGLRAKMPTKRASPNNAGNRGYE